MSTDPRLSRNPTLQSVVSRLKELKFDLERLQLADISQETPSPVSGTELIGTARSVAFIWNSRKHFLSNDLIADPGWSILLSLKIAELTHYKPSVTTVCIDSGVPATTALRWIKSLESGGFIKSESDSHDKRRRFIYLTESGSDLMARYLQGVRNLIRSGATS